MSCRILKGIQENSNPSYIITRINNVKSSIATLSGWYLERERNNNERIKIYRERKK
jgi:hypothetical protein